MVFGLLALNAWGQVLLVALHRSDDPPMLTGLQFGVGLAAAATAWGAWRRTRWASGAAIAFGVMTASMLTALPSLLQLPAEARRGLWIGAVAVMLFASLSAAYFRSARRQAGAISTGPPDER